MDELQEDIDIQLDPSLPNGSGEYDNSTPFLLKNSTGEDKALYFCCQTNYKYLYLPNYSIFQNNKNILRELDQHFTEKAPKNG